MNTDDLSFNHAIHCIQHSTAWHSDIIIGSMCLGHSLSLVNKYLKQRRVKEKKWRQKDTCRVELFLFACCPSVIKWWEVFNVDRECWDNLYDYGGIS